MPTPVLYQQPGAIPVIAQTRETRGSSTDVDLLYITDRGPETDAEGMLPYGPRSFLGYRLLTEYFTFPSKFLFVDIGDLQALAPLELRENFEVYLFLDRTAPNLEPRVEADTFRLGCAPVINLFTQPAEPIRLTHTKTEYHVIPDVRRPWGLEVYSVGAVESVNPQTKETVEYRPFFSFQHAAEERQQRAYWYTHRRPSVRRSPRRVLP